MANNPNNPLASSSEKKPSLLPGNDSQQQLRLTTLVPVSAPTGSRCKEDCYEEIRQVGEGMYGKVYKMREKRDPNDRNKPEVLVALKEVRMDNEKEGFPITAIREIKLLAKFSEDREHRRREGKQSSVSDDFVVKLKEIVTSKADHEKNDNKGGIYMVFEYMEHDLAGIRENRACQFDLRMVKLVMWQILSGLHACHKNRIIHRDLKCSNVLMNNEGDVKLADFGLARKMGDKKRMTPKVITLWYRPPELLLGNQEYTEAVDMWSAGCIMAELLLDKHFLPGNKESDQVEKIFAMFGYPTERTWPGIFSGPVEDGKLDEKKFPLITSFPQEFTDRKGNKVLRSTKGEFEKKMKNPVNPFHKDMTEACMDLLRRLLAIDPSRRISAYEACQHAWFREAPDLGYYNSEMYQTTKRSLASQLRKVDESHEYEQRLKRKIERSERAQDQRAKMQRGLPQPRHFN